MVSVTIFLKKLLSIFEHHLSLAPRDDLKNFKTAKKFTNTVKEKALGRDVLKSVSPGQLMIKICHEELIKLMGGNEVEINLTSNPSVVLMSGLQGSGKTTFTGKLGNYLTKKKNKKVEIFVN